jgi:hypothetical protein
MSQTCQERESVGLRRTCSIVAALKTAEGAPAAHDRSQSNCVAISTAGAFEMMSFRNSSSSSEVQAFALFTFFIVFLGVKESCAITPC